MTQSEERYAHLLQPIRDLASNWNVNIANELEDYLEVLEGVQFSFAEGGASLNFAEAALLIQGSACIYSKKVEYLHTLVYQALEFIAERRKRDTQAQKAGGEDEGGVGGADSEFEDEEQFLSLDDILEEGTGIDLDEAAAVAMPVALRPPATLLALEDTGNSHGDGDAGNYRIASCVVHHSGALLLEQRDGAHLGDDLQPVSSEVGAGQAGAGSAAVAYWAPPTTGAGAAAQAAPGAAAPAEQLQQAWGGFDGDDDDGFGGGFDDDGDYGMDPGGEEGGLVGDGAAQQRHAGAGPQAAAAAEQQEGEEFDPYSPLDPNSRGTLKPKPYKKAAKVLRKPKARQQQRRAAQVLDCLLTAQAPVAGLLFPEFAHALKQQEAEAKASQQGGSRTTSQRSAQTVATAAFTYLEAMAGFAAAEEQGDEEDGGGDFYGGGGFDDADDDYAPLGDFALPDAAVPAAAAALDTDWGGAPGGAGSFDAADADELTYEELCRAHIEAFINAAAAAEVQSELAARVSGWRGKMAPALEEEDARPEFDIHLYGERILQRIAELTCAGREVCAAELRRGELPPVTFGQVVGVGLPKYEASRSFSSMLQLINNGNVRITKLGGGEGRGAGESGGFTLTLLDRVLPHKKVADYRALGGAAAQQDAIMHKAAVAAGQPSDGEWENQGVVARKGGKAAPDKAGGKAKRQKG